MKMPVQVMVMAVIMEETEILIMEITETVIQMAEMLMEIVTKVITNGKKFLI